jgi:hypothetical protein
VVESDTSRARLLEAIDARRRGIERYLADQRPVSNRLTTISVISSCVAAALAAGPAVGGEDFAATVQGGLGLGQSQAVWRLLCLAAVVASVTAAIAANLSKSSDITARVGAAEAANSLLEGLHTRLSFSGLSVADAAQQYQEIIARIPWISERGDGAVPTEERAGDPASEEKTPRRPPRRPGPYLLSTTTITALLGAVAVVGLVSGLLSAGPDAPPAGSAGPSAPAALPGPEPEVVETPEVTAVSRAVYSGPVAGARTSLAVVVDGDRAVAYLCDGRTIEAWLEGSATDGRISLSGRDGAVVTAASDGPELVGSGTAAGTEVSFALPTASTPAGVYEARVTVDGVEVRLGWAALADGTSVGMQTRDGRRTAAPPLTLPDATFELGGAVHRAELLGGAADVVAGN